MVKLVAGGTLFRFQKSTFSIFWSSVYLESFVQQDYIRYPIILEICPSHNWGSTMYNIFVVISVNDE